jgi:hypothetical protein
LGGVSGLDKLPGLLISQGSTGQGVSTGLTSCDACGVLCAVCCVCCVLWCAVVCCGVLCAVVCCVLCVLPVMIHSLWLWFRRQG